MDDKTALALKLYSELKHQSMNTTLQQLVDDHCTKQVERLNTYKKKLNELKDRNGDDFEEF
jgi:hypothetical protein